MTFRTFKSLPRPTTGGSSRHSHNGRDDGERFGSGEGATVRDDSRWDLMLAALAGLLLAYIWRLQDLYSIFAAIRFPLLMAAVSVVVFLMDGDRRRALTTIRHPIIWLATLILVIMVLSVPGSLYPGQSFSFITNDYIKTFLMMVLIAAGIRTFRDVERLVMVMVLGAMLYAWFILTRFTIGEGGRLSNLVYYDANDLAMVILSTIPLALYFISRRTGGAMKWVSMLGILLFIMAIVKSGSRGGFIGLVAVGIYLLIGFTAVPKKTRILAVSGATLLMLVFGSARYWEMMGTLLNPQEDYNWANDEGRGRTEIWKRGIGYMLANPLLGVGARAFPIAEGTLSYRAEGQQYGRGLKWSTAHNSFVEIGAELGVFALIAFVLLLYRAFRTARGTRRTTGLAPPSDAEAMGHALAGSVVGYAVAGFFLSQAFSAYLYAVLGIVVGLAKVTRGTAGPPVPGVPPRRARSIPSHRGSPVPAAPVARR